jgi:hypothetical protein
VSEDAVTAVHLRQLGGVQTAAANAAQIDFNEDLIGPQRGAWSVLQCDPSLSGEHHCGHRHLQSAPCLCTRAARYCVELCYGVNEYGPRRPQATKAAKAISTRLTAIFNGSLRRA